MTRNCLICAAVLFASHGVVFLMDHYAAAVPFSRGIEKFLLALVVFVLPLVLHAGLFVITHRSTGITLLLGIGAIFAMVGAVVLSGSMWLQFLFYFVLANESLAEDIETPTTCISMLFGFVVAPLYWLYILVMMLLSLGYRITNRRAVLPEDDPGTAELEPVDDSAGN